MNSDYQQVALLVILYAFGGALLLDIIFVVTGVFSDDLSYALFLVIGTIGIIAASFLGMAIAKFLIWIKDKLCGDS